MLLVPLGMLRPFCVQTLLSAFVSCVRNSGIPAPSADGAVD